MKYYFDAEDHYMYTGYHAINGELYYFNADGKTAEWLVSGRRKVVLYEGGYVIKSAYINGITYQFDKDGVMQE